MRKRNVNNAMAILTINMKNGILPLDEQTMKSLKIKHPEGKQACKEVLVNGMVKDVHPIKFEEAGHLDSILKDQKEFRFHEIMEKPM